MRLFVSVDLHDLADEIAAVQEPLRDRSGLKPTDAGQAHVTLKFLGEVGEDRLADLRETITVAVEDAGVEPFDAALGGYGVFPSLDYVSVVWLGVRRGDTEMTRLHEAVEDRTTALGFDPKDHEFTPHVTLARMEHAGAKEHVQELVRTRDPDAGETGVEAVHLKESTLTADGPRYETVESFPL